MKKNLFRLFALLFVATFIFTACSCIEIELIPPPNQTDEGVEINGVVWATRNVDAPGTFADNPEDAGKFFQWNRRQGWSATGEVMDWDSSKIEGIEWKRENDPCPPGWRVPTADELYSLLDSDRGWMVRNSIKGRLFGTYSYQIFLPAVGFRYWEDGSLHGVGTAGSYSRSTQQYNTIWFVENLWLDSSSLVVMGLTFRANGQSVRCVAID